MGGVQSPSLGKQVPDRPEPATPPELWPQIKAQSSVCSISRLLLGPEPLKQAGTACR